MKLIHCSDIHLDSKLETNLSPDQARQRNHEICLSFERMAEYAAKQDVKAILICGDLFDGKYVHSNTIHFVMDVIKRFHNINFLYLRGNHDEFPILSSLDRPRNLNLFSDQWLYYKSGNIVIAGVELNSDNAETIYDSLHLYPENINIVMLHGQVSSQCSVESIALNKLKNKAIDYLALGHIHTYQTGKLDYRGMYCYSGCLEGRGFDECGDKGFVLIEINDNKIQSSFVPFAFRKTHSIELDISQLSSITEILGELRLLCSGLSSNDIALFTLTGTRSISREIDCRFLENMLSEKLYSVKIKDQSIIDVEGASDIYEFSLKTEFIRQVNADTSLSDDEKNQIIKYGLSALSDKEINK